MLSLIGDLPQSAVGVKASGKVTKEEFDETVVPAIDALVKNRNKINYLLVLETNVGNFEGGAMLKDAMLGLKHFTKWNRVAVVTDQKGVEKFSDVFGFVVPGEFRGYPMSKLEEAKAWVSEPDLA